MDSLRLGDSEADKLLSPPWQLTCRNTLKVGTYLLRVDVATTPQGHVVDLCSNAPTPFSVIKPLLPVGMMGNAWLEICR